MADVIAGLKYAFHIMRHPIDGFYDMRHENRGNLASVIVILACLIVANVIQSQYSGFLGFQVDLRHYSVARDILNVLIPVLLWCAANWSITALVDGEGRFIDIFMATVYSLSPLVFTTIVSTILYNIFALDEQGFIGLLNGAGTFLTALLLFLGMLTIHQFSVRKTVVVVVLTVIGMVFIIFLVVLFASVLDKMLSYFMSMYTEVKMRM